MKRLIFISLLMTAVLFASAQTQSGVVKTRGRLVNGKLVPGTLLHGATVEVEGRQPVLAVDGRFSFPVTGSGFRLKNVYKQGYTLVDVEVYRFYKYSATPLQIVMEVPGERQSDQLAKERALRRQLEQRLQQREDEIEAMNLSLEEKNRLLLQVSQNREDNEKIIKDVAKYYSTLDYDQLDDFQRQVNQCLETGDVARADSLLKSRGDLDERISQMRKEQAAEAAEEAAIKQRQVLLDEGREGTRKKLELIAADCYNYHQRYLLSHQHDSAAYYLRLRSSLDSNNLDWMGEAAYFTELYLADYNKALCYYHKMLTKAVKIYGEVHPYVASAYTGVGRLYLQMGKTDSVMAYFDKALEIRKKCFGDEHQLVANSHRNLGEFYLRVEDYEKALDRFNQALSIYRTTSGEKSPEVAICYNSMGICYMNIGDSHAKQAMDNFSKALAIDTALYGTIHPEVSFVYMNVANMYAEVLGDNAKASEYYQKSLDIEKQIFGENHPRVARVYDNMASNEQELLKYDLCLEHSRKALEINRTYYGEDNIELATSYYNIGLAYFNFEKMDSALCYLKKAIEITKKAFGDDAARLHTIYFFTGASYNALGDSYKSLEFFKKSLSIEKKNSGQPEFDMFQVYNLYNIAEVYFEIGDSDNALNHYSQALKMIYDNFAEAHGDLAKEIEEKILEIKKVKK